MLLLLNFSHPFDDDALAKLRALAGEDEIAVRDVAVQLDLQAPLAPQIAALVAACDLSPRDWVTLPILVNPPGYAPAALLLAAELHGRMGHFPAMVWLRPVEAGAVPRYELAELVNLQAVRDAARKER